MEKRFEAYRREIEEIFFGGEPCGEIVGTKGTGDMHLHGEAVTRITASCGKNIFYKPRDGRSTELLGELCLLLFGENMVPGQIAGDGFCFQKEVEIRVPSDAEMPDYYARLGKLAALFYALGSTDMHNGNVVPCGASPVVVDTETLLCAKVEGVGGTGEFSVDYGEVFPDYAMSVGESMVLPRFFAYHQTSPLYLAESASSDRASSAGTQLEDPFAEGAWARFSPDMRLLMEMVFSDGFSEGYKTICDKQSEVFSILDRYRDIPLRYLLRSTQSYAMKIFRYAMARDDAGREKVLESLKKGLSESDIRRWAKVLEWERACILEKDIPYFWLSSGGRDLMGEVTGEPLIRNYLEISPIEYAKWRIGRMSSTDLSVQRSYIHASLSHFDFWKSTVPDGPSEAPELSVSEAVAEVEEAIRSLWEERIPISEGRVLWHTPLLNGKVGCLFGVGEGFSGVAVFLSACAASPLIKGKYHDMAEEMAEACFRDMTSFAGYLLEKYPKGTEERILSRRFNGDFGFADGLSGLLWAMDICGREKEKTAAICSAFRAWGIGYDKEKMDAAFRSALSELPAGTEDLSKAGRILGEIRARKRKNGSYQVFRKNRHGYFLPAFLRGSTGIAYVMLKYAERKEQDT